jgi:ribosomal protein L40E
MSCGYGCSGCGRCQGLGESKVVPRGLCLLCKTLNGPSATVCKKCGAPIDNSKVRPVRPGTR